VLAVIGLAVAATAGFLDRDPAKASRVVMGASTAPHGTNRATVSSPSGD
jgi:DHA1 family inner membrane transport protein